MSNKDAPYAQHQWTGVNQGTIVPLLCLEGPKGWNHTFRLQCETDGEIVYIPIGIVRENTGYIKVHER